MLNIRDKNRSEIMETWFYYDGFAAGLAKIDDKQYFVNSYGDDTAVLYQYIDVEQQVIEDVESGKVPFITLYSDPSSVIKVEIIDDDDNIVVVDKDFADMSDDELPDSTLVLRY